MARTVEVEPRIVTEPIRPPEIEPDAETHTEPPPAGKPTGGFFRQPRVRLIVIVAGLLLVTAAYLWSDFWSWESTDDAQIDGHIHPISARIGGYVIHVNVEDNQYVEAGTVLVQIDPKDYQVALARARAELADAQAAAEAAQVGVPITSISTASQLRAAQAEVTNAQAGVAAAEKQLAVAEAKLREAEATRSVAEGDLSRYKQLLARDAVTQQQYDQALAQARASAAETDAAMAAAVAAKEQVQQARGRLEQAQATLRSAQTAPEQVAATRSRAEAAQAAVQKFQAAIEQAQLNLQYTAVTAPVSGLVGKKSVEVGQYVQPGQLLMAIVQLDDIWVTANFKETQLKHMRPGQPAVIYVDAYDREYRGRVDSIGPATGARFSLFPPENATGNSVKVVQRVPVKITLEKGQDPKHLLRPGMSVVPSVKVR